jgi:hypothetical protein
MICSQNTGISLPFDVNLKVNPMHFVSETSNRPLAGAFNCSSNTLVRALRMTFSGDTLGTHGARALGNLRRPFINPNVTGYQSLEGIGVRSSKVSKHKHALNAFGSLALSRKHTSGLARSNQSAAWCQVRRKDKTHAASLDP